MLWTAHHWQHWLARGAFPDHPWRTYLQRSALTLKGLTYAPTGAIVAAATTSLPETPQGERNWDYRYTWIRDATFALWGMYTLGFDWEANDFFYFVADCAEQAKGQLQIMYGIDGRADLTEETLDHLTGYEGARPVRIGNGAFDQDQHDVWGAVLDSIYLHTKSRDSLPERLWPILDAAGRGGAEELEGARPRHLGGPRRAEALHVVQAHVLGRAGPRRAAGRAARGLGPGRGVAEGRGRDPRRHLRERPRRARRLHPALRHGRARRLRAADAAGALPAADGRAHPRDRAGDRRRADRGRPGRCATAPRRPTTASTARRARSRSARSGSSRRCARSARSSARGSCASGCCPTRRASGSTRRRSTRARAATSATSRRRSRTSR